MSRYKDAPVVIGVCEAGWFVLLKFRVEGEM